MRPLIDKETASESSSRLVDRREVLKRSAVFGGGALLAPLLAACGSSSSGSSSSGGGKKVSVGMSISDLSIPFYAPMASALRSEAAKRGVELKITDAKGDPSTQFEQVNELQVQGVDVIGIAPVDTKAIVPAAKSATAAGTAVVGCGGLIEGYPYIGSDDLDYGRKMGRLIQQALKDTDGPKRIALLRGAIGSSPDRLRRQGIGEVLQGTDIQIVAEAGTDWSQDKAFGATQDFLGRFGKGQIQLVHGFGGALEVAGAKWAHTKAGRSEVLFTGGELTKSTAEAIRSKWEYGVVIQDPGQLGRNIIDAFSVMGPSFKKVPASAKIDLPLCLRGDLSEYKPF